MRLYHVPGTRSSRVHWLLEEIGKPYDLTVMTRDERHEPPHLARHPLGRVPVVHDGEGYVFESAGLCLHLAESNPEAGLLPAAGTHDRALVYQWVFYAMLEMEPGIVEKYIYGETDAARTAAGVESYRKAVQVIEDELAGKDYLVGGTFSVADLIVAGVAGFGGFLGMNDGFPNLAAYLERINARPALLRANAA
jgi:glutathione S-transferase